MSDRMDTKLRELTYRLIEMAPEAPPFPEESMVQLKPAPSPVAPARKRSPLVWVGAAAVIALLVIGVPLLLFGPSDEGTPATSVPAPTVTVPPTTAPEEVPPTTVPPVDGKPVSFSVYLFSNASTTPSGEPALVAVQRTQLVDESTFVTPGIQTGLAIHSLLNVAPEVGYSSEIPVGTQLISGDGSRGDVVVVDLSAAFESGGGTSSMMGRLAQLVFTATQFPEIHAVEIMIDGEIVDVFSSEGIVLDGPQTREDWFGTNQLIYVDAPAVGAVVSSPFTITGYASTFEATVEYEVTTADGAVLDAGFTTASCGDGCWGEFAVDVSYTVDTDRAGFVTVFETSVEDGNRQHLIRYPVVLSAPEIAGEPPSRLNVGIEEADFGFGYYPGRVVITSPITVSGGTDADAEVTVNGEPAERFDLDGYRATVDLAPGENTITVVAMRGGESIEESLEVRYAPDLTVEIAYLTQVGRDEIVADYIQWLTGDEANQAAFEDGVIGSVDEGLPNGFYIRNVNDELRTLTVTPETTLVLFDSQESGPLQVPVADWAALFQPDGSPWDPVVDELPRFPAVSFNYYTASFVGTPYWLYLDADGTVIHIEQQYLP